MRLAAPLTQPPYASDQRRQCSCPYYDCTSCQDTQHVQLRVTMALLLPSCLLERHAEQNRPGTKQPANGKPVWMQQRVHGYYDDNCSHADAMAVHGVFHRPPWLQRHSTLPGRPTASSDAPAASGRPLAGSQARCSCRLTLSTVTCWALRCCWPCFS